MKRISENLRNYLINQTIEDSCDNIISQNTAQILRGLDLVEREYPLKGRIQDQTCLVVYEGSEEEDYRDSIKFRVEN